MIEASESMSPAKLLLIVFLVMAAVVWGLVFINQAISEPDAKAKKKASTGKKRRRSKDKKRSSRSKRHSKPPRTRLRY
ncbi:MAG: hypothetical protein ACFB21_13570 [Opitutales bacterium]